MTQINTRLYTKASIELEKKIIEELNAAPKEVALAILLEGSGTPLVQ